MLNHALRVPFCIAPPSHCVHGQILIDKSRIRNFWSSFPQDLDQKSGVLSENRLPHLTALTFCAVFSYTSRKGAALAFHALRGARRGVLRPCCFHIGFFKKTSFRAHLYVFHGISAMHLSKPGLALLFTAHQVRGVSRKVELDKERAGGLPPPAPPA